MVSKTSGMGSSPRGRANRDVVQLVVCLVWDQVVEGSSPFIPTNFYYSGGLAELVYCKCLENIRA